MTALEAIDILETGAPGDPVAAMQSLIDSGIVWQLQGSYQRAAMRGIESGNYTFARPTLHSSHVSLHTAKKGQQ
jgi:hypothetical protein